MSAGYNDIVAYHQQLAALWKMNSREKTYDVILNSLQECEIHEVTPGDHLHTYLELNTPKIKQCYDNALAAVMASHRIKYVLGFAMGLIPVAHAWICREEEGKLVHYDPTSQFLNLGLSAYGSVKIFSSKELAHVMHEVRRAPMLEDMPYWAGDCCRINNGENNVLARPELFKSSTLH